MKNVVLGVGIGAVLGAAITFVAGKQKMLGVARAEVLAQVEEIEQTYDKVIDEMQAIDKYCDEHCAEYINTKKQYFIDKRKAVAQDIDATDEDHVKASLKDVKVPETKTDYNKSYPTVIRTAEEEVEYQEACVEADVDDAETFQMMVDRKCATDPVEYVEREEFFESPCNEFFSREEFIYFVKDNSVRTMDFDIVEDVEEYFGASWRNKLAAEGEIYVIDYDRTEMRHIECNLNLTIDEAIEKMRHACGETVIAEDTVEYIRDGVN